MKRLGAVLSAALLLPFGPAALSYAATAPELQAEDSLPTVTSGARPGPDILYAPPPRAPQLENAPGSVWTEQPLLVSGASAYSNGEFLYQGWLFDDHGAAGVKDPSDPFTGAFLFASKAGTLTYPTDARFASNAADLVELRVRALPTATAFRLTYNTLIDPAATAFTLALGESDVPRTWPSRAGVRSPAQTFVTVHGSTAELTDAATGSVVDGTAEVSVDLERRQVEVVVPRSSWDPANATARIAAGTGLWDVEAGHYLQPEASASATTPGGAAPNGAALFDLAFRPQEDQPDWERMGVTRTTVDAAVLQQLDENCWWRECAQAAALRDGDVSAFSVGVDFAALRAREEDDSRVPTTGSINRIFASHHGAGQGLDWTSTCGRFPTSCSGLFASQLAPYNVYVPDRPTPAGGWGLTLLLHASTANYNEYMGSNHQRQLAERGAGSLTVTSSARDPQGDYTDAAEADVFEAWADVARHYPLDDERTAISGYSMGAGGTYKLAERWPDLFARAMAAAAVPFDGKEGQSMASLRHVPLMTWMGAADEGTPAHVQQAAIDALTHHGLRFVFDQFLTGEHLTQALNDEYGKAADFLGDARVERNPARVTYVVDPRNDAAGSRVVADHAYWLSDLRTKGDADAPRGVVDAHSLAFGVDDAAVTSPVKSTGVLLGGNHGPSPYVETVQDWQPGASAPPQDRLVATFTGLTSATLDTSRARLTCAATLELTSDQPMTLTLPACSRTVEVPAGTSTVTLAAPARPAAGRDAAPSSSPRPLAATGNDTGSAYFALAFLGASVAVVTRRRRLDRAPA